MPAPRARQHRLPKRLDYTLIPAPLDLSLTTLTEKSPLPAIIVTPSSPAFDNDYAIAFLSPSPKPTLFHRLRSSISAGSPLQPLGTPEYRSFSVNAEPGMLPGFPPTQVPATFVHHQHQHPSEMRGILRLEEGEPLALGGHPHPLRQSRSRGLFGLFHSTATDVTAATTGANNPKAVKLRTAIILVFVTFLLLCHLLTHSLLAKKHFLDYTRSATTSTHASMLDKSRFGPVIPQKPIGGAVVNVVNFDAARVDDNVDDREEFIVIEEAGPSTADVVQTDADADDVATKEEDTSIAAVEHADMETSEE